MNSCICNLSLQFSTEACQHINSFTEQILRDAFKFFEAREAGKLSASQLLDTNEVVTACNSGYHRSKKLPKQPTNTNLTELSHSKDACNMMRLLPQYDEITAVTSVMGSMQQTPDTRSKNALHTTLRVLT